MIEDKICPFMSRCEIQPNGDHLLATVYCQKERCMAWEKMYSMSVEEEYGCRLIP